jgi:predicted PurR-regulated permease PerM
MMVTFYYNSEDLSSVSGAEATVQPAEFSIQLGRFTQELIADVVNVLVQFGIALVIFFYMINAAISLPGPAQLGLDPTAPAVARISTLTEDVRKYMTILTVINLLVGLGDTIFLLILGVDYAFLWGLLAWFMGYIPSVGFFIALIPPVLLAYAQFGLPTALIVLLGYVLINGGVQNIIQPKIMGQDLKISPVIVFIALVVWGFLVGGIGAILAVPLTLLVLIIMENFEGTRMLAVLMRYTGEAKKEERREAAEHMKNLWGKVKSTFSPARGPKDIITMSADHHGFDQAILLSE